MTSQNVMAPSPQQPLNRQRVRRIPGFGRTTVVTTGTSNGTTHGTHKRNKRKNRRRVGTINVSTMRGKEEEIVELMDERKLDILGLCETRLKGSNDRLIHYNYRLVYSGDDEGSSGVGLVLAAEIAPMVERVRQMNNRIINVDLNTRSGGISMVQVYTPQQGRLTREKDAFYEQLQECIDTAKYRGRLILCGDMNGHIGQDRAGYERVIGHHVIGGRNAEGLRVLDFANLNHMSNMNTFYQHQPSHKWTWY